MSRKCFISFKKEDELYKKLIQNHPEIDIIDKSLDEPIGSNDEDYIMQQIRDNNLSDSTVTIFLIGSNSHENQIYEDKIFIKRELQASLYDGTGNTRNGILGVVLPSMYSNIYANVSMCDKCGANLSVLNIDDNTVIREFHKNYHIPHNACHWDEDDRYCVLIKWEDFIGNPNIYIERAFEKRNHPISKKVKVYP